MKPYGCIYQATQTNPNQTKSINQSFFGIESASTFLLLSLSLSLTLLSQSDSLSQCFGTKLTRFTLQKVPFSISSLSFSLSPTHYYSLSLVLFNLGMFFLHSPFPFFHHFCFIINIANKFSISVLCLSGFSIVTLLFTYNRRAKLTKQIIKQHRQQLKSITMPSPFINSFFSLLFKNGSTHKHTYSRFHTSLLYTINRNWCPHMCVCMYM